MTSQIPQSHILGCSHLITQLRKLFCCTVILRVLGYLFNVYVGINVGET